MRPDEKQQLHMIWPMNKTVGPAELSVSEGYAIRAYVPGDEKSFFRLMIEGDFDKFDDAKLQFNLAKVIPGGWFFATRVDSSAVCGTAMCLHNYTGNTPFVGDVGWLVCSPGDRGNGLGASLTARVTQRFLDAGYSHIQLHTEHYRLAAIRTYLKTGYIPVIESSQAHSLWRDVCARLCWTFAPERWSETMRAQESYAPDAVKRRR
jgi:mycothiol synthase